jgi:hypothetical protein
MHLRWKHIIDVDQVEPKRPGSNRSRFDVVDPIGP